MAIYMSRVMSKPTMWLPNRSYTNRAAHAQEMATCRGWKFLNHEEEELYYPFSENKDTDHLCSHCEAGLRICVRIYKQNVCFIMYRSGKKNENTMNMRIDP